MKVSGAISGALGSLPAVASDGCIVLHTFDRLHRHISAEDNWGTEFLFNKKSQHFWMEKKKIKSFPHHVRNNNFSKIPILDFFGITEFSLALWRRLFISVSAFEQWTFESWTFRVSKWTDFQASSGRQIK